MLLGRQQEAELWFRLSESKLDRLGVGSERTRSWLYTNFAGVLILAGDFERAERYERNAIGLKENALGRDHPDVAISLVGLASILTEEGRPADALPAVERALEILMKNGDPDSDLFARAQDAKGIALIALDRAIDAEPAFRTELRIYRTYFGSHDRLASFPLQGIGESRLLQGHPDAAIPFLEDVLRFREVGEPYAYLLAETRFSLARALWDSGQNRVRALKLARQAREGLADHKFPWREQLVVEWLRTHKVARS